MLPLNHLTLLRGMITRTLMYNSLGRKLFYAFCFEEIKGINRANSLDKGIELSLTMAISF